MSKISLIETKNKSTLSKDYTKMIEVLGFLDTGSGSPRNKTRGLCENGRLDTVEKSSDLRLRVEVF